ncbi:MAG: hypothetical protein ACOYKZ_00745 [Chlamydiia bacterium]
MERDHSIPPHAANRFHSVGNLPTAPADHRTLVDVDDVLRLIRRKQREGALRERHMTELRDPTPTARTADQTGRTLLS